MSGPAVNSTLVTDLQGESKKLSKSEASKRRGSENIIYEQKDEEANREASEEIWTPQTPKTEEELKKLLEEISLHTNLPDKPYPKEPRFKQGTPAKVRLRNLQRFISSFEYNYTQANYFEIRKDLGMKRVFSTAKDVIREGLPIKCIEAVFLACYLTKDMDDFIRLPIRFNSKAKNGNTYKHIVMAVNYKGKWGALGLSRKDSLMYKEFAFESLSELITDYKISYEECGHDLQYVGIGLPFAKDVNSIQPIHWRALMIKTENKEWKNVSESIDLYWSKIDAIERHIACHGKFPIEWVKGDNLGLTSSNNNDDNDEESKKSNLDQITNEGRVSERTNNANNSKNAKGKNGKVRRAWSPITIPQPPKGIKLSPPIQIPTVDNKTLEVSTPWIDPKYLGKDSKSKSSRKVDAPKNKKEGKEEKAQEQDPTSREIERPKYLDSV